MPNYRVDYFDAMRNKRSVVVSANSERDAAKVVLREQLTTNKQYIYAVYRTESEAMFT